MHNVILLEKEWRKYSIKKWAKRIVFVLICLGVGLFLTQYIDIFNEQKSSIKQTPKIQPKIVKPQAKKVIEPIEKPKQALQIQENTQNSIESIKERYYANRSYEDAIYLAKTFYKKKEYDKVEYWTLEANKLNSKSEESWILFAKTKFILGEEEDAIHALEAYLEKNQSSRLEELLLQMSKALSE